jgi:hypothetical protein
MPRPGDGRTMKSDSTSDEGSRGEQAQQETALRDAVEGSAVTAGRQRT